MESVFIIDPDAAHAAELQQVLESAGYPIVVYRNNRSVSAPITEDRPDLVVVVPASPVALRDALASARSAVKHLERQPELLFVLRWTPRGPSERILGDRWNVQVLYER